MKNINNIRLSTFNQPVFYNPLSFTTEEREKEIHSALIEAGITPQYIAEKLKQLLEDEDLRIVLYALKLYIEIEGLYKRFNQPIIPIQVNIDAVKERLGLNNLSDKEIIEFAKKRGIRTPDSYTRN
jgi:hypothetical protein